MSNQPDEPNPYEHWLAQRAEVIPPAELSDRIMSQVIVLDKQHHNWSTVWLHRVESNRVGQWAVCGGALAIGCLPFFFLAYVAKFLNF